MANIAFSCDPPRLVFCHLRSTMAFTNINGEDRLVFEALPSPPFSDADKQEVAKSVYQHIWRQSMNPQGPSAA